MRPSSEWSLLLSHRDSRVSKSDSSPWVRSLTIELRCILRGETRGETCRNIRRPGQPIGLFYDTSILLAFREEIMLNNEIVYYVWYMVYDKMYDIDIWY